MFRKLNNSIKKKITQLTPYIDLTLPNLINMLERGNKEKWSEIN